MSKLSKLIVIICLNILISNNLYAEILIKKKVLVTSQVSSWVSSFRETTQTIIDTQEYPESGYTECRETKELNNAYLCLSLTRRDMNLMFARVTLFFESPEVTSKGHIVSHDNSDLSLYRSSLLGNDLKLSQFLLFHKKAVQKCNDMNQDPNYCLSSYEKEMYENLIFPLAKKAQEAVVITFSQDNRNHMSTAAHEFMHAQYFLNINYKNAIREYWLSMDENEKKDIIEILSIYYDKSDDDLMANEFGAYMLQSFSPRNLLYDFLPEHRGPLLKKVGEVSSIINVK